MNENENPTDIPQETRDRVMAEHYRSLSAKGNQARRGTAKAQKHARLIGALGVLARRKKAALRRAEKASGKG
jgi:hypothetical protein